MSPSWNDSIDIILKCEITWSVVVVLAGNEEATFSIDRENGNMILARPLDWEQKKSYNLTVSITDTVDTTVTQAS